MQFVNALLDQATDGSISCSLCSPLDGVFQDEIGQSSCKQCSDYSFPSPCLPTADLTRSGQLALTWVAVLCAVVSIGFLFAVVALRSHRVFWNASPVFLSLILLGTVMVDMAVLTMAMPQTDQLCQATVRTLV